MQKVTENLNNCLQLSSVIFWSVNKKCGGLAGELKVVNNPLLCEMFVTEEVKETACVRVCTYSTCGGFHPALATQTTLIMLSRCFAVTVKVKKKPFTWGRMLLKLKFSALQSACLIIFTLLHCLADTLKPSWTRCRAVLTLVPTT